MIFTGGGVNTWDTVIHGFCSVNPCSSSRAKGGVLFLKWFLSLSGPLSTNSAFLPVFHLKLKKWTCVLPTCAAPSMLSAPSCPAVSWVFFCAPNYPGLQSSVTQLDQSSLVILSVSTHQPCHLFRWTCLANAPLQMLPATARCSCPLS